MRKLLDRKGFSFNGCGAIGEMRPPLTVVLINNAGGGIFSFLPIADELPPDTFSQLWATPQNVDLAGLIPQSLDTIPHNLLATGKCRCMQAVVLQSPQQRDA